MNKFMKDFSELIDEFESDQDFNDLPLVHTTREKPLYRIMQSGQICYPKPCEIYDQRLVYFFYGKASYYTEVEMGSFSVNPPVSILYDFKRLKDLNIKRVLPFDSGGYPRYGIDPEYSRDDYTHSNPKVETCKKLLKLIYSNKENYLNNKVSIQNLKDNIKYCFLLTELKKLYENSIINGDAKTGSQVFSIEVQYEEKIDFFPIRLLVPFTFFLTDMIDSKGLKSNIPDLEIDFYGEDEIGSGIPLTGAKYHELMVKKLNDIITNFL